MQDVRCQHVRRTSVRFKEGAAPRTGDQAALRLQSWHSAAAWLPASPATRFLCVSTVGRSVLTQFPRHSLACALLGSLPPVPLPPALPQRLSTAQSAPQRLCFLLAPSGHS